jgi:hypothetical protein
MYKEISQHKYFRVSISLFITSVISILLVENTFEFSNNIILDIININFENIYALFLLPIVLIGMVIWYFTIISPLITLKPIFNKLYYKVGLVKLNLLYLLLIFLLNICLGRLTNLHFSKIPTAYPGEILKSFEELERQEENNNMQDDYPR